VPELSCLLCGRAAKSPSEHAEAERDLGHRPAAIKEPNAHKDFAYRRVTHGARIAFAGIASRRLHRGRRTL
jgi:hypothetical protein